MAATNETPPNRSRYRGTRRRSLQPWDQRQSIRLILGANRVPAEADGIRSSLPVPMPFADRFALKLADRNDVAVAITMLPVLREPNCRSTGQPGSQRENAEK